MASGACFWMTPWSVWSVPASVENSATAPFPMWWTAAIALFQMITVVWALGQNRKQRRQTAFSNSWWRWVEIDRFFVDHSHLKPYIYENRNPPDATDNSSIKLKAEIDSVCEMLTDHWAGIYYTRIDDNACRKIKHKLINKIKSEPFNYSLPEVEIHRAFARIIYRYKSVSYNRWIHENSEWYSSDLLEWITGIDKAKWRDPSGSLRCIESGPNNKAVLD
ncbi:MAG: hypothetical protein IT434_00595 [Phycisphaerales bacterium]|jgi:hypothetical protein|nr:hypothetical protein [Phycisphaerales bacterium]